MSFFWHLGRGRPPKNGLHFGPTHSRHHGRYRPTGGPHTPTHHVWARDSARKLKVNVCVDARGHTHEVTPSTRQSIHPGRILRSVFAAGPVSIHVSPPHPHRSSLPLHCAVWLHPMAPSALPCHWQRSHEHTPSSKSTPAAVRKSACPTANAAFGSV